MSELDATAGTRWSSCLRAGTGQAVITTTDLEHVPGAAEDGVVRLTVSDGRVLDGGRRVTSWRRSPRRSARRSSGSATSWRRRRCSPRSSGSGRRPSAPRSRPRPAPSSERGGVLDDLVLGVGLGAGARPDGARDSRAAERLSARGADHALALRHAAAGEVVISGHGRPLGECLAMVAIRRRFCCVLQANWNTPEGPFPTARCAILLYTNLRRPGAPSVARDRGVSM